MVNQKNIETLFDCLDESATLLYQTYKMTYLDGLVVACENIMSNSVEQKYSEILNELESLMKRIEGIDFQKEEIRKAFQYAVLRGFKHSGISNQMITPDTIGIFINYLLDKLYRKQSLIILDPLLGTGNLVTTIANHSEKDVDLIGVDQDESLCKLANALFDMMEYGDKVFYQDSKTFHYEFADAIIMDASGIEMNEFYSQLTHHERNLIAGGFMIAIVDSDSIQPEILMEQSQKLSQFWKLFGLISLPNQIVKTSNKSIIIFQREGEEVFTPKSFLLVDLPDFTEQDAMGQVINRINDWFNHTEFYRL